MPGSIDSARGRGPEGRLRDRTPHHGETMSQSNHLPVLVRAHSASRRGTRFAAGALLLGVALVGSACGSGEGNDATASGGASTVEESSPAAPPTTAAVAPQAPTSASIPTTAATASTAADAGVSFAMPDAVGMDLQSAQDLVQTNGVFLSVSHDLLGSRNQLIDSNWVVCTQNIPAGQQVTGEVEGEIDFGVVKREESCP